MILIVSFYKNAHLVGPLCDSLCACSTELAQLQTQILFYNDSPEDIDLQVALSKGLSLLQDRQLNVSLVTNSSNIGFIQSVNQGLQVAQLTKQDALILNSDALLFPGTLTKLKQVAYSDPLIGFVSPRSNNASICTFPSGINLDSLSPQACFEQFQSICTVLPEVSYAPTAVGFCLWIKASILIEFGLLDPIYNMGYNEENDLIMRANQFGYRAVIANHAYAWHQGSVSFSTLAGPSPSKRDDHNAKTLHTRYPEYLELTDLYRRSPEYRAERIVSALVPGQDGKTKIAFDLSSFGKEFNGTREAGKSLVLAAAAVWPTDIRIIVLISRAAWFFYELDSCPRLEWGDIHEPHQMAAIIRFGQPFQATELRRLLARAPVIGIFMLDTISADCGYLRVQFPEELWRFTLEFADLIFTNSQFTADQIRRRFTLGANTQVLPSLHSLSPSDYGPSERAIKPNTDGDLLIIGNAFTHKAITPTAQILASQFPMLQIGCIGLDTQAFANVSTWPAGHFSESQMDGLYCSYKAIVFPSHYEGFGLPLMHALARSKPIFLRKLPVFEEIVAQIQCDPRNIIWFETSYDLVELIRTHSLTWQGDGITSELLGWERSAQEVYDLTHSAIEQVKLIGVANRLRWFDLAFPHHGISPFMPPAFSKPLKYW